jgi:phage terminase large subunit-like protein
VSSKQLREQTIRLAYAPAEEKRRIISNMTWQDALSADAEYERWTHESQIEPEAAGWRTWLMLAGRGFGKTRAGAEWVERIARSRPGTRIALAGASIDDARRVMVEGVSGVLSVAERRRGKVDGSPAWGGSFGRTGARRSCFPATIRTG